MDIVFLLLFYFMSFVYEGTLFVFLEFFCCKTVWSKMFLSKVLLKNVFGRNFFCQ